MTKRAMLEPLRPTLVVGGLLLEVLGGGRARCERERERDDELHGGRSQPFGAHPVA